VLVGTLLSATVLGSGPTRRLTLPASSMLAGLPACQNCGRACKESASGARDPVQQLMGRNLSVLATMKSLHLSRTSATTVSAVRGGYDYNPRSNPNPTHTQHNKLSLVVLQPWISTLICLPVGCAAAVRERGQRRVGAAARLLGRLAVHPPAATVDQGAAAAGAGQVRACCSADESKARRNKCMSCSQRALHRRTCCD